jgi:hypothetical protein
MRLRVERHRRRVPGGAELVDEGDLDALQPHELRKTRLQQSLPRTHAPPRAQLAHRRSKRSLRCPTPHRGALRGRLVMLSPRRLRRPDGLAPSR